MATVLPSEQLRPPLNPQGSTMICEIVLKRVIRDLESAFPDDMPVELVASFSVLMASIKRVSDGYHYHFERMEAAERQLAELRPKRVH